MSRTYEYVFSDPANSDIKITTGDFALNVTAFNGVTYSGYAIESVSGTFNGEAITGLYGQGGQVGVAPGLGAFDNTIFVSDSQGDHGSLFGIDQEGVAIQTTFTTYAIFSFDGSLMYASGRNAYTITLLSFTEEPGTDTTPPMFVDATPATDTMDVAAGSNIVLTFNEAMKAGSGSISISDGAGDTRVIAVTDTSQVHITGNTVTIDPTLDLCDGATYHVTLAAGVLADSAGNAFGGIAGNALDFSTAALVSGSGFVVNGTAKNDHVVGTATDHSQTLNGLAGNDVIALSTAGGFAYGQAGNDTLIGGSSAGTAHYTGNYLYDFEGNNTFQGGSATGLATVQNFISGGSGDDVATGGSAGGIGGFVYNLISVGDGQNVVVGGSSSGGAVVQNFISAGGGFDRVTGGNAAGTGSFTYNQLSAGEGQSMISGGNASGGASVQNFITGGGSGEIIVAGVTSGLGSAMLNVIRGGAGSDVFVFGLHTGQSTLLDFAASSDSGHDVIDLSAYGFTDFAQVLAATTATGASSTIHLPASDGGPASDILLDHVAKGSLVAVDFVL